MQLAAMAVALGELVLPKQAKSPYQLNDNSQIGKGVTKNTLDFDTEDNMLQGYKTNSGCAAVCSRILTQQQTTEQSME